MRLSFRWSLLFLCWTSLVSAEPLLPGLRFLPGKEAKAVAQAREFRCSACHQDDLNLDLAIPSAPDLRGVARRLKPDWIRQFLNDPSKTKPGTRMPHLLHSMENGERKKTVEELVHFLASLKGSRSKSAGYRFPLSPVRGKETFHKIGCANCHDAKSLRLEEKWTLFSLIDFLQAPLTLRPDGRMPDHLLTQHEAADLSAYLLDLKTTNVKELPVPDNPPVDTKRVAEGRKKFRSLGCANCHDVSQQSTLVAPALSKVRGKPNCSLAHYGFENSTAANLPIALTPARQVQSLIAGLQCNACHERKGTSGWISLHDRFFTGDESLAGAGRLPPTLNHAGRKLRPSWIEGILATPSNRLRPYLNVRMPIFGGSVAKRMTSVLRKADKPSKENPLVEGSPDEGVKLVGAGGMNCITCHGLGKWKSIGIQALNLEGSHERLEPFWFKEYMLDPTAYRPGTLMPSFWPKGKSTNPHILNGNTSRQLSAIWAYLKEPITQPPGYPPPLGEFEILVTDRPVVQRTFMEGSGPHALAIALPGAVNLVFDTRSCNLTELWKGKFIDGYNTWFDRFATPTTPLGHDHLMLESGLLNQKDDGARFDGYEIDGKSVRLIWNHNGQESAIRVEALDGFLQMSTEGHLAKQTGIVSSASAGKLRISRSSANPQTLQVRW